MWHTLLKLLAHARDSCRATLLATEQWREMVILNEDFGSEAWD